MIDVIIERLGVCLPTKRITNQDLVDHFLKKSPLSPQEIEERTGIRERYFIDTDAGESLVSLALEAIHGALPENDDRPVDTLFSINVAPPESFRHDQDMLYSHQVNGTNMDSLTFEAKNIISRLRAEDSRFRETRLIPFFDGCGGLLTTLINARMQIEKGEIASALVIAVTDISRCLDPADEDLAILFGDGACALYLRPGDSSEGGRIVAHHEFINRDLDHLLFYSRDDLGWHVRMPNGGTVLLAVIRALKRRGIPFLEEHGHSPDSIDHFIFHQASGQTIDAIARHFQIAPEKLHRTLPRYGNTSAASIGITLHDAVSNLKKINPGDTVFLCAFGAGFKVNFMILQY